MVFSVIAAFSGLIGIMILLKIHEKALSKIISLIIIFMAIFLLLKNDVGLKTKQKKENFFLSVIIAISLGIYGGFFGGGLGSLLMLALVFLYGFDFVTAAANARLAEFIMSIVIVAGFIISGLIDKQVVIPYTIASAIGGYFGASIAAKIGNVWIKRIFITVSIIVGIKLFLG